MTTLWCYFGLLVINLAVNGIFVGKNWSWNSIGNWDLKKHTPNAIRFSTPFPYSEDYSVNSFSFKPLKENVKKADIVRSMFRTGIEGMAQMAFLSALAFGVRKIYFLGSFINVPLARELITTELEGRILLRPKVWSRLCLVFFIS